MKKSSLFPDRLFLIFDITDKPDKYYELLQEYSSSGFDNNYGTKCLLKCDNELPPFTNKFIKKKNVYHYDEVMIILATDEWVKNGSI